jgi:hypothetical protein
MFQTLGNTEPGQIPAGRGTDRGLMLADAG